MVMLREDYPRPIISDSYHHNEGVVAAVVVEEQRGEYFLSEERIPISEHLRQTCNSYVQLILPAVTIVAYLLLWVANAEMMQGRDCQWNNGTGSL
jgi:hypothetical protein